MKKSYMDRSYKHVAMQTDRVRTEERRGAVQTRVVGSGTPHAFRWPGRVVGRKSCYCLGGLAAVLALLRAATLRPDFGWRVFRCDAWLRSLRQAGHEAM